VEGPELDGEDREAAALARLAALGVATAGLGRFTEEEVAAWQPVTRAQFDRLRATPAYWPTAFHEDKQLESLLAGTHSLWSPGLRAQQERMLGLAGGEGGVVADSGRVVAAVDRGSGPSHPLGHAAMLLVDLVARTQGGGASALTAGLACTPAPAGEAAPRVPTTGPYLCTGYTVYLAREPCHMCAMALLHSRAAMVLYRRPSKDGALASADRLLDREGLNHRYQVFRAVDSDGEGGEGLCC
jgi:tRNA-specific adenosine deaminase 3